MQLDDFFERHAGALEWVRPEAGPIAFPRMTAADVDVEAFCERLAAEAGVLLLPGRIYGHPGQHFRIGFGRRNLPAALARLEAFIDGRTRGFSSGRRRWPRGQPHAISRNGGSRAARRGARAARRR